VGVLLKFGN